MRHRSPHAALLMLAMAATAAAHAQPVLPAAPENRAATGGQTGVKPQEHTPATSLWDRANLIPISAASGPRPQHSRQLHDTAVSQPLRHYLRTNDGAFVIAEAQYAPNPLAPSRRLDEAAVFGLRTAITF